MKTTWYAVWGKDRRRWTFYLYSRSLKNARIVARALTAIGVSYGVEDGKQAFNVYRAKGEPKKNSDYYLLEWNEMYKKPIEWGYAWGVDNAYVIAEALKRYLKLSKSAYWMTDMGTGKERPV